ncbi:MAG: paraquat-inducible protein A, partial [Pedobacter sp.]
MSKNAPTSPANKSSLIKIFLIIGLSLLLIGEGYFGIQLHELSERQEHLKKDFADMNNINLGLFSVDQWHDKVEHIIKHQVRDLNITAEEKRALQKEIEGVIIALINKAEALVTKPEKKSIRGKLVKFAVKNFVNVDTIKKQVPGIARNIIRKIDNPNNKKQLSKMALKELDEFEQSDVIDSILTANAVATSKVYKKYKVESNEELNKKIQAELKHIETATSTYCSAMLICIVVVLTLWWLFRKQKAIHATLFIMSLLFAFILLG